METETMGRVLVEAKIENLRDLWDAERGLIPAEQVRVIVVGDALVDTGATILSIPTSLILQLGLNQTRTRRIRSAIGLAEANVYDAVRLTIQGRDATIDVMEVPDGTPVLIGQVPLELLDFVVDPHNHRLIGDPRHGGELIYEMY